MQNEPIQWAIGLIIWSFLGIFIFANAGHTMFHQGRIRQTHYGMVVAVGPFMWIALGTYLAIRSAMEIQRAFKIKRKTLLNKG
jgi:ABC-type Na+ efflux pump permease subunit